MTTSTSNTSIVIVADERPVQVDVVIRMDPMIYAYWSDMQELSEHLTDYFVKNLLPMVGPHGGDLCVIVATTRGDGRGGFAYKNGHFVKDAPKPTEGDT